jgi:hypothetical protein
MCVVYRHENADPFRNKPIGRTLRGRSPARGASVVGDGSGADCMGQDQTAGYRLKQDLRKRLGNGGAHLLESCGVENLSEGTLSCCVVRPLRISIPDAVAPMMEARTKRSGPTAEQFGDARPCLHERGLRAGMKSPAIQDYKSRVAIIHKLPEETGQSSLGLEPLFDDPVTVRCALTEMAESNVLDNAPRRDVIGGSFRIDLHHTWFRERHLQ